MSRLRVAFFPMACGGAVVDVIALLPYQHHHLTQNDIPPCTCEYNYNADNQKKRRYGIMERLVKCICESVVRVFPACQRFCTQLSSLPISHSLSAEFG